MLTFTCSDKTVITYRLPNVIEMFDLQDKSGWGRSDVSGFYRLARVLENAECFIEKVEGTKTDWQACLNDRDMADDLSQLALRLISTELEDDEKKS